MEEAKKKSNMYNSSRHLGAIEQTQSSGRIKPVGKSSRHATPPTITRKKRPKKKKKTSKERE